MRCGGGELRWRRGLPTYDRARTTVLAIPEGELKEVNVDKLGAQQRIASVGDDHECFLSKFKDRVDPSRRRRQLSGGTIVERPIRLASTVAEAAAATVGNDSANYRERRRYKMENHGKDHEDALKDVEFREQPARVDLSRLAEIADTEKAASQMQYFVKHWEYRRANNARLLSEELGHLSQQREEIEQKKQQIMEEDQRHNALKC
ncbi:hypothetical protein ZWY2020_010354 [Hordeum vulgare]|nr:hypothetical protein ZWY2020_010354 [Hordeum vulgare]